MLSVRILVSHLFGCQVDFVVSDSTCNGGDLNAGVGFSYNGLDVYFTSGGTSLTSPCPDATYSVEVNNNYNIKSLLSQQHVDNSYMNTLIIAIHCITI